MRHCAGDFSEKLYICRCRSLLHLIYPVITATRMTDSSDPPAPRPFNNSTYTKMKERAPFEQVMTCKAPNLQRIIQVVQRVAQKSCRRACELFCCPLDALLPEQAVCWTAQSHQPTEDKTTQVTLRTLPSTILIVNISNSTLIDCVIGTIPTHQL